MPKKEFDAELIARMAVEINDRFMVIKNLMGKSEISNKLLNHAAAAAIHVMWFMKDIYEYDSGDSMDIDNELINKFLEKCGCDFKKDKK